jgi:D-galactarolactone isomerase
MAEIIDCHMHVYDRRYPLAPTTPNQPPSGTVAAYGRCYPSTRPMVVQPSHYGLDNRCTLAAAARLKGWSVVVVPGDVAPTTLKRFAAAGAVAARFHMVRSPAIAWADLPVVAAKIAPLGWSVHLQLAGPDLLAAVPTLATLPCPLVLEHFGRPLNASDPNDPGITATRRLLAGGRTWVKLSASYGLSAREDPADPAAAALAQLYTRDAPERVLWGSNWPHPNRTTPPPPDAEIASAPAAWFAGERRPLDRVLHANAQALLGFVTAAH